MPSGCCSFCGEFCFSKVSVRKQHSKQKKNITVGKNASVTNKGNEWENDLDEHDCDYSSGHDCNNSIGLFRQYWQHGICSSWWTPAQNNSVGQIHMSRVINLHCTGFCSTPLNSFFFFEISAQWKEGSAEVHDPFMDPLASWNLTKCLQHWQSCDHTIPGLKKVSMRKAEEHCSFAKNHTCGTMAPQATKFMQGSNLLTTPTSPSTDSHANVEDPRD